MKVFNKLRKEKGLNSRQNYDCLLPNASSLLCIPPFDFRGCLITDQWVNIDVFPLVLHIYDMIPLQTKMYIKYNVTSHLKLYLQFHTDFDAPISVRKRAVHLNVFSLQRLCKACIHLISQAVKTSRFLRTSQQKVLLHLFSLAYVFFFGEPLLFGGWWPNDSHTFTDVHSVPP